MQLNKIKIIFFVFSISLLSCQKLPDFNVIPKIEVENSTFIKNKITGSNLFDTVRVTIKFEDGDGDLGLDQSDTSGIYDKYVNGDKITKIPNIYNKNFYVDFYIKNSNNTFIKYDFGGLDYNGRFPYLNPDRENRPLSGTLTRDFTSIFSSPFSPFYNQIIKLEIYIFDRKLNKSNVVQTNEFLIK